MRPGQHNNKRGRNRNRGRHGGGGGGGGGNYNGNPANRVFDSNGPDVKLRGTAQTVAEKYMQLGRDAQASGDNVMAESYYQHSEHYYRLWLANQPAGQPIQFARRTDEEMEEDQLEGVETESEEAGEEAPRETRENGAETAVPVAGEGETRESAGDNGQHPQQNQPRNRDNRDQQRGERGDRGGERGERGFRRWPPRRSDRRNFEQPNDRAAGGEQPPAEEGSREEDSGNWDAPSFLTRPVPPQPASSEPEGEETSQERRPRREYRPRRQRNGDAPEASASPQDSEG